jgi:hypothetical protein
MPVYAGGGPSQLISLRPPQFDQYGDYSLTAITGTMAAGIAADAEVFQFRWTSAAPPICIVKEVTVWAGNLGTAFAAGFFKFEMMAARAFTAAGTGGGTLTLTTNNGKLRTAMGTTAVGEVRVATTAALTAGTKTLDAQGLSSVGGGVPNVAGSPMLAGATVLFNGAGSNHPLILAQNEGFIIRTTVPATGTWTAGFTVKYAEVTDYAVV